MLTYGNRQRNNPRDISVISTPHRGGVDTTPGVQYMPVGMAPAQQPMPAPVPMAPAAMPGNRFGSSQAFQQSLNRGRALRNFRAGSFASLRDQGESERSAAAKAYAGSQLADANLQTGGAFQAMELAGDENKRANAESGASVGLAGSQAGVNQAIAGKQIPAAAAYDTARAGALNAGTEGARAMLPITLQGAKQEVEQRGLAFPGQQDAVRAGINKTQAETGAITANAGASPALMKTYADQLKTAQARIHQLEQSLSQYQLQKDSDVLGLKHPQSPQAPQVQTPMLPMTLQPPAPATQPTSQPAATAPATNAPTQEDLEHTAQVHGITVDEVKRRLGIQ